MNRCRSAVAFKPWCGFFAFTLLMLLGRAHAANPQIKPGQSAVIQPNAAAPFSMPGPSWSVSSPRGSVIASDSSPSGWSVSLGAGNTSLHVSVPSNAPLGAGYYAAYVSDGGPDEQITEAANFDVIANTSWPIQFGTSADDTAASVATDSQGNVIISGGTNGSLFGSNAGGDDFYLTKYDQNSNLLWSKTFGTSSADYVSQIVVDHSDNTCFVGSTGGNLFGTKTGTTNAIVAKLDTGGNILWSKQFGTQDSFAGSVAIDGQNNVYIAGATTGNLFGQNADANDPGTCDCFLVKYDSNGNILWSKQFGAAGDDTPSEMAVDDQGNIFVVGGTPQLFGAATGETSSFLAKFDPTGNVLWGRQFGGSYASFVNSLCLDGQGNAYITGRVSTFNGVVDPEAPDEPDMPLYTDCYVIKSDPDGNFLWTQQISTPDEDMPKTIRLDQQGNVLVAGYTKGSLFAQNSGDEDIFLAKYGSDGTPMGGYQYGNGTSSEALDLCVDNQNRVYVVGSTAGSLYGNYMGGDDAFVARFDSSFQLIASARRTAKTRLAFADALGVRKDGQKLPGGKTVPFVWAGKVMPLNRPVVMLASRPYMYVGYLRYGTGSAGMRYHAKTKTIEVVSPEHHSVLQTRTRAYLADGVPHTMSGKPVVVNGRCYVPLDVVQALLPIHIRYASEAGQVRVEPSRIASK